MYALICKSCSNGCKLYIERSSKDTLVVSGNKCMLGVSYAYTQLKDKEYGRFLPSKPCLDCSSDKYRGLMELWGLKFSHALPGKFIHGSPERTLFRSVVDDCKGSRYLLERIDPANADKKINIALRLDTFFEKGLPVNPYLKGKDGRHLQNYSGEIWEISAFVESLPLDRSIYWKQHWRGEAIADFLLGIYDVSSDICAEDPGFSVPDYIEQLVIKISRRHPDVYLQLQPVLDRIRNDLYPVYSSIDQIFSHGDAHPFNMLWGPGGIRAVIDWEFSGKKPVFYDAALVIGCVGSEDPAALESGMVSAFKDRILQSHYFPCHIKGLLPVFIAAVRFGWLSEWLRREDTEMIDFELFYMRHLLGL